MDADEATAPPDRAFWLLSDRTRLDILRAVWAADADGVTFSDIRARLGNPNSGQFNYHLNKLTGHYLTKSDGRYHLSSAGREVVRAILAGSLTERPRLAHSPIEFSCDECGGELVVRYADHGLIECGDCGSMVLWNEFPPAGLDGRSPDEFAAALDRWTQHRFRLAMDDVCPSCASRMAVERPAPARDGDSSTLHRCRNCKYEARIPLFGHVIDHPAVVSYFHERGVDIASLPYWELRALARDFEETVTDTDPWTAEVIVGSGDRQLRFVLDERLSATLVDEPAG